jgi:hypothetical protein
MTDFSQEVFDEICVWLAVGESMRTVCARPGMPDKSNVFRWIANDASLRDQYARAKYEGCEALAEEMFDISDEIPPMKDDGSIDSGYISYAKHRTDVRKWYLSKIAPKKYGDKFTQELTGADGAALPAIQVVFGNKPE